MQWPSSQHNIPVRKERLPDPGSYRHEQSTLDNLGAAGKPQHNIKNLNRPSSRYKKRRETKQASPIADRTLTRQLAGPLNLHPESLLSLAEVNKKAISPINDNHGVLPEQAGQQQPMIDFMAQTSTVDPQTGITLNVGIPCIVVHHGGPRIKACIQYIGNVEGLVGPRVGVISKDFIGTSVPALSTGTYLGRHYFDVPPDDGKDFASGRTCAELDLQDSPERINHKAPATARYCRAFFVRPCDILVVLGGAL
ncbi:hypothetical protein L198_04146 [Cryptococcus wingfieldii CBS 7118]|uniref:CAP-Gly domain-containing protein n=1 Tax=Cryptococcus wingfieldii CBS 7118 TaxID=1295528 RepID=A0A1E3J6G6_9TREE|nr:hypothetical protein L198_04146 [Cryptococcus wingfieldii CBS 7118]ODN96432.1 hypothetical protein L198_04146 [Cryptococcus wingfieldii CBS 7118]